MSARRTRSSEPIRLARASHGTESGYSAGCGCDPCKQARLQGNLRRKRSKTAAVTGVEVTVTEATPEIVWRLLDYG